MGEEQSTPYEDISLDRLGYLTWIFGIIAGLLSLVAQLSEFRVYSWGPWWGSEYFIMFLGSTVLWSFSMVYYFFRYSKELNRKAGNIVSLTSLLTALFWIVAFALLRIDAGTGDTFIQAQMFMGFSGISLGFTLLLAGLLYMTSGEGSKAISVMTGIVFLCTGVYGILVGVGSGLSAFPMFTIFDIPWIAVIAIASSIMGIVANYDRLRE
jgi:hypothetical protein